MTAPAALWRLDRLSNSAREAAELASLGAGMSLSSWLTRLIGDTCAAEGVVPSHETPKIIEFTRDIRDRARSTPRLVFSSLSMPATVAAPPSTTPAPEPIPPALGNVVMPFTTPRAQPQAADALAPLATPAAMPSQTAPGATTLAPLRTMQAPAVQSTPSPPVPAGATMLTVDAVLSANLGSRRGDNVPEPLLADIATRGVRQPIIVRRSAANPEQYEIICGHRRWRAAQRVGLAQIPALVVSRDDPTAILCSLGENLQTDDLTVIDEAQTYLRLLTQCAIDAAAITAAIGRDRKHVVQSMRLLGLPPLVRHLIGSGVLSRDHAFVLLDAPNPEALADAILAENLSVEAARQRLAAAEEAKP